MGQPVDETTDLSQADDDERLGEAIELYLSLVEQGEAPGPETFASRYPDIQEDVRAALEGLELVNGLVGRGTDSNGSSHGAGPGRNIESGRRIAGYRVVRELGRGGMGTVYEAVHVGLDRPVALKVLGTHAAPDSSARRRFLNEARTAAALHHTHIVPVFDVGQVGGLCYFAMQRIEGSGLDRVVRHLRQVRTPGGGGAGSRDPSSGSTFNRMWIRVSESIPWHRPHPSPGGVGRAAAARRETLTVLARPRKPDAGGAATLTWSRKSGSPGLSRSGEGTLAASAVSPSAFAAARYDEDDAPPPFDPPRGSLYHRWVAEVGLQAAEALAHAHHHGVIHRDVKPSNLLIDGAGTIWVADFGLARRLADPGLTHHDSLLGTPRYMSPEQGRTGVIDGRTDVYSLGATLYELLTFRPPFDGTTAAELLDQIAGREPIPPRAIDPRIPRDLETIVLKSLAKRPGDRYDSAARLGEDLARFLNREPVKARRISPVGRLWRMARRHPGISSVSAVASVLVLAIAAFAYNQVRDQRDRARDARDVAEAAWQKTEKAVGEAQSAWRKELWRHAALVRHTNVPDRRASGLDLLKKAAALKPEPELKARLRDEAAEFLVLRDIEPRDELPTGPTRDLIFNAETARLTALSSDGEELAFWDVNHRQRIDKIPLSQGMKPLGTPANVGGSGDGGTTGTVAGAAAGDQPGVGPGGRSEPGPRAASGPPRGGPPGGGLGNLRHNGWWGNQLTQAGSSLAVILPGAQSVSLLDAMTGAPVRELSRRGRRVLGVFGEPTGKHLATIEGDPDLGPAPGDAFSGPSRAEFQVLLWDLERLDAPLAVLDSYKVDLRRVNLPLIGFAPDGKTLALAAMNSTTVKLFSAEDGREISQIESQADVTALALGGDDLLATASGGTIQLWKAGAGAFSTSLSSMQSFVTRLQFNPQGTLLATSGFGPQVELWDAVSHKLIAVLPNTEPISDFAFSAGGRTLVVGGRGVTTSFWKINEPAARTQINGFEARPGSLAFRNDGLLAIGDGSGEIWLWRDGRGPNGEPLPPHRLLPRADLASETNSEAPRGGRDRGRDRLAALAFDARSGLAAHDAQGLKVWAAQPTGECKPTELELPLLQGGWRSPPLGRSADGRTLALIRGRSVFLWEVDHPERVLPVVRTDQPAVDPANPWSFAPIGPPFDGSQRRGPGGPDGGDRRRFQALQIAPAGDRLYLLEDPGAVQVWALQPGTDRVEATRLAWNDALREGVVSMALRPDGKVLALGDRTGEITLLDADRLTVLSRIHPETDQDDGPASALSFSPDGRRLAAGSQQGSIHVWAVDPPYSPRYAFRLPGQNGRISSLAFDSSGHRLAALGSEPIAEVWNLAAFERELRELGLGD